MYARDEETVAAENIIAVAVHITQGVRAYTVHIDRWRYTQCRWCPPHYSFGGAREEGRSLRRLAVNATDTHRHRRYAASSSSSSSRAQRPEPTSTAVRRESGRAATVRVPVHTYRIVVAVVIITNSKQISTTVVCGRVLCRCVQCDPGRGLPVARRRQQLTTKTTGRSSSSTPSCSLRRDTEPPTTGMATAIATPARS